METGACGLYILRRKSDSSNRLVLIPSLAEIPCVRCAVAVGSRIYMFGDDIGSSSFAIDCRSHTVQLLQKMPTPMEGIAADVIDKEIYVIGQTTSEEPKNIVAVFHTETQMWEPEVIEIDMYLGFYLYGDSVAIAGKMYMRNFQDSFVYGPKENKWETDEMLNSKNWNHPFVVGDIMYYYDTENELRAYDTKNKYWRVVEGVRQSFPEGATPYCSSTVSYCGKIGVFTPILIESTKTHGNLFMEIAIERCHARRRDFG